MLIVGAGPIGMTAALVLARYGIRSVLIDRKDTFNDGSRAICIARPSMHILERIGAVAPFVEKALGWRFGRSYYRGEQIFRLEMPQPPGRKISADVQSAAAVHREIPARCGRDQRPHRHALAE